MTSQRFTAEEMLRAAASGAFPSPGDVLVRTQDGWIFSKVDAGDLVGEIDPDQIDNLPFTKITGTILPGQVPLAVVKQHEANLAIAFTQLTGQILSAQVPKGAVFQHLGELLELIDWILAELNEPVKDSRITASSVLQHLEQQLQLLGWVASIVADPAPFSPIERIIATERLL